MIFIEPEMDYFRMQLHRLALPRGICQHDSSPRNSRGLDARTSGKTAGEQKEDNEGESISLEERVEVLHRALMTALRQRFPYESPDTLEHVYILAVSHLSTPPLASTTLSCEEIAALWPTENFLPPELRFRTFPSHLNPLLSSTTQFGSTALPKETEKKKKEGKAASNGDKEDEKGDKGEEKVKDTLADQHYNDTYFLLLPELTREQQLLYQQQQRDANRTRYRRADVGGVSSSNVAGSEPSVWNHTLSPEREESVRVGEGMMGFRVLDGTMIHNVAVTQTSSQDAALRSLQFAVFKIPLSRFTPDEQQYYTNKREEARFCADISSSLNNNNNLSMFSSTESSDNYMNEAMRRMLAFEMPERYGADDDALMKKFFSRCNTVLRCYSTPVAATKNSTELTGEMQEKEKRASSFDTTNTVASDAIKSMESISNISSALGVRRLVYSFAPCDCYHLVTDDNNPLYYAKSSRAAYEARTVSITLVSDLTAAAWPSPTTSVSSHATAIVPLHEKYGGGRETARINRGGGLEGLVCSNQVSRAASPDPCLASTKSTTSCNGKSLSPQSIFSQKRKGSSVARASFHQLTSKTDGFFSLTTSLSCNNVSGNPKHRKESLLEKGLLLGEKEECQPNEATSFQGVNNRKDHTLRRGGVLNLFRLLSTSSAAQHELRHGVIRPVVSVAVLDRKKPHFDTFLNGEKSAEVTCHGLLDHTWYSIPVQPVPEMQDDVQWMPIVFGSTECISDVGYRTAMQMGFFPNKANKTKRELSNNQAKSGVLPTLEEARRSLTAGQQDKGALAPLDPNLIPRKEGDPNKLPERDSSLTTKKREGFGNEDMPASVTARRGGVAMDFGNDDRPASVTARRGGVAMNFGNDDRPASVTARRGGVAMNFGNDDRPASVTARRGGVAMDFGNDDMYGKNRGMDGLGSDVDWRRSASYRSPKAQRPTVCERVGFAQGEPEPSFGIDGGSPLAFRGTARLHKQNASPGLLSRETGMGPPDGMYGVTPMGRWRASSPGPMFGGGGQRGSDWGQNACRPGVAREDSPLPRLAGARRSRLTTGLDPFGKLSSHPSPRPHNGGAGRSSMVGELNYLPPYNDRWQSHDSNNDFLNCMGVPPEHPGGNFGHATSSSLGGGGGGRPPTHRATDFLASPLSSMSCNGVPIQEENNARRIGGYDRGFAPDTLSRFPPNQAPSTRQNARTPAGNYGTRNFNHPINNDRTFPRFSSNLAGEAPNYPSNGIFARMNTLYDNGASRMPILDEYGSPRNGSRVRPRGDQAMDMAWSHRWSGFTQPSRTAAATKWATAARRGTPPPPSCRVNRSAAMPWRNRTTTGVGVRRQGLPATRPPLAPSSRLPFRSPAASIGYRTKATPSVRGLTLRERVRLRQQELRREANVNALREELDGNYCLGNDLKKSRTERFEAFLPKTGNALNPSERFNGITSSAAIIPNTFHDMTMMNTLNNGKAETVVEALGKPAAASLESYWEQVRRLQSLTDPFIEADGVNVSFCLRDLANAFLSLPGGTPKEYDLTKAVWLDEGVSYFISSKPNRFHGGWESYVQHLNLYQQPFYLRERAFIFVLRVPYQPNLRVCVAVHNLDDFIALLQQRPLRQISVTKEEKWMRERLYGGENKMGDSSQTQRKRAKAGIFKRFLHYLHIIKKKTPNSEEHATGDDDDYGETQERGWKQPKVTWRQRLAFLRLQAEATLRGVAWKTFTSPLLTDPTLLQARMSFLSNRTATYAALNHRLNTIEAVSAALEKKRKEELSKQQQQHVRMIENYRVGNVNSVSFGINRTTLQEKQEPAPAAPVPSREPQASSAPLQSTTTARGMKPKREPFRVNRIGDGSATAVRQPREAPPTMRPAESMSTRRTPRQVSETEMGIQTPSRTTLAPYSSSVSLKPLPTSTTTAASSASALAVSSEKPLPSGNEKDALILCAESIAQKANFRREVSSPPLITILKFMSSWDQKEQQKQIFDGCSAQSSTTKMDPIFAGLLPTPTEIHRQEDRFNITVSHMQQLLQWQWEYHQNSYEASPLPVFRGALVASTSAYFNVTGDSRKMKKEEAEEDGSGISPLSRSLLLSLIRWGWLAPMDYKSSRNKSRLYFLPKHRILSLFVGTSLKSGGNAFFLSLFIITIWRNQFLWLTLVYISGKCFLVAIRGIFGTCTHGPAALDSATSIVYRQSEAAVETMLEKRQFFRTQSLAIRILKVQNYLQNVCSRSVMLLRGYSPFLSLIIGSEVLLFWFLLLCYNYIIFPLLSGTRVIMSGVILEYLLQLFRPLTFIWSSDTAQWCVSVLQPSDTDGKMVCFLFLLYLLWCLRPWSPLRWMCRKTWELFLHDDALVRRPLLSF